MTALRTGIATIALFAATPLTAQEITLYSGRGETLVAPLIETFTESTGIEVNVRYGGTAELAVLLNEEGAASPADIYWAQDVAALGQIKPVFAELPGEMLEDIPAIYRDGDNRWTGTSGRMRLMVYSTERMQADELPATMAEMTDDRFAGTMALPPTNGSFLAHVTALRVHEGDEAARAWLQELADNDPVIVSNNTAIHTAIADGEADWGLTNNYYLSRFLADDPDFPADHALFEAGDIGNLMMVAGAGVLESSDSPEAAMAFIEFLLSDTAQQYFAGNVHEYPVRGGGVAAFSGIGVDYGTASEAAIEFDLNELTDLEGTLEMLEEVGLL